MGGVIKSKAKKKKEKELKLDIPSELLAAKEAKNDEDEEDGKEIRSINAPYIMRTLR